MNTPEDYDPKAPAERPGVTKLDTLHLNLIIVLPLKHRGRQVAVMIHNDREVNRQLPRPRMKVPCPITAASEQGAGCNPQYRFRTQPRYVQWRSLGQVQHVLL